MKVKHLKNLMLFMITVLGFSLLAILPAGAQVQVQVGIQLPPPIVFSAPPQVVVLPGTYVYVAPDVEEDVFFFDGFWWRPWNGHWYRSPYYDRGWSYYSSEPVFYREVHEDWRHEYHAHTWGGRPWRPERMHHDYVQKNWNTWHRDKHWEKQNSWGVQGYRPRPQPVHHENYQHPQQRPQPQHHENYQHPQQRPQPQHHENYQHPQGRGEQRNQPPGHTQSPQGHQVQKQQPHNPPPQHQGKGSKGNRTRPKKH